MIENEGKNTFVISYQTFKEKDKLNDSLMKRLDRIK